MLEAVKNAVDPSNLRTQRDKLRSVVAPSALRTERDEVQAKLEVLFADQEENRLEGAILVTNMDSDGMDGPRRAKQRKLLLRADTIRDEIGILRSRRRELDNLLAPSPVAVAAIHGVEVPADLIEIQSKIDAARKERADLLHSGAGEGASDAKAAKFNKRIEAIEEQIRALRVARSVAQEPYDAAVVAALAPLIREQAERLMVASLAAKEAVLALSDLAQWEPASIVKTGSATRRIANIDTRGFAEAETFARFLVDAAAANVK